MKRDLSILDRNIGQKWSRILQEAFKDGILREVSTVGNWETIQGARIESRLKVGGTVGSETSNPHASLFGLECSFENLGTINSDFAMVSGLHTYIVDGGTYTAVSHLSGLWVDSHLNKAVTSGLTELIYMSNNGSKTLDQAIYIYGNSGKISNLFRLDSMEEVGMITIGLATTADDARKIKISIDGTSYYVNARIG